MIPIEVVISNLLRWAMKLLTLIGAGVLAGYCYKKAKYKKGNAKNCSHHEAETESKASNTPE